jgi:hypothetical protein
MMRVWPLLGMLAASACVRPSALPVTFEHDISSRAKPWTAERVDRWPGKFAFAIFSDLYDGDRAGVFEVALAQLALLRPTFILSVGDLISGGSEDRQLLTKEWDRFDARARQAGAPVFHVGGNHDLTNQTMKDVFAERYGRTYYHFLYDNVLFLVLDSEDYAAERMRQIYLARDSAIKVLDGPHPELARDMTYFRMPERMTGEIGPAQSAYFQRVIADHPKVRWTFLFMHKPVWQRNGETSFAAIEAALAGRPYTVFNGHLHSYGHTVRGGHDYITLGTTSGSQAPQDSMAFDHVTWVTLTDQGPTITNLRLEGILDRTGHVPAGGDSVCFQASRCRRSPR